MTQGYKISRSDAQAALDHWAANDGSRINAAAAMNVHPSHFRRLLDVATSMKLTTKISIDTPEGVNLSPDERGQVQKLRDKNAKLEAALREVDRDNTSAADVRKFILGLSEHTPEPPKWMTPKNVSKHGTSGVPSVLMSDWHVGETVTMAETNGINDYNLDVAEARIHKLVDRVIDLCYHHMTNARYPGIVVNLNGDIVSGGIHPELAETDADDLFPIILWSVDRIIAAITTLAEKFGAVFVTGVPGNHGRVFDRKPRAKGYVHRNADWLIYCLVEKHFTRMRDSRINFLIPDTGEALFRVYDHRYLCLHGDDLGVKGGDGIIGSIGPIMRGEIKVHGSSAQIWRDYDTLELGHWHQTLWLPRTFVNNTLKGMDEYARRMLRAPATAAAQSLWFTHPKYGPTAKWEILLQTPLKEQSGPGTVANEWVSWRAAA